MATTENITVLFTDLVGSTELASSLTPEAGDEVRRKHFSALRQAIVTSGGTEVKNLGDGLMVVFPAASAALSCAVTMQQAVHGDNAGSDWPLGIRVGLSAGEATREADDYFGDPVIEAARLCARAEGGQILVTDLVRANAGRRSSHTFTSVGELELKGLPEPIETLQVSWDPLGADAPGSGRVPLPTRFTHRPVVGVIGRENELALLDTAAKRVASGEGRELFLLAGEPGQGKTTLVSELARQTHDRGMTVLLGRCDEEVGAPYRPFQEALSHLVAHVDEELLQTHVASHGGELARMVPALGQRLGELPSPQTTDPDTERYLLYAAVVGLLEEASRQRPVVLVLDDLHWADKPSLQLLRHVVANSSASRLLILGTYRDAELSAAHPLTEALATLHREPAGGGVSTIDLKGLEDTGVIAFMESAAGHELDDAGVGLAHQLYRETDGNPFFVAEILRNLSESGDIVQDATTGLWAAKEAEGELALPHSVRTVIATRVSRLGEGATKVLSTASVIGRDFDLDLLAETTKVDEDELIDLLEEAQRAVVVNELPNSPGRYSFSHALVQHTLYEDLGGSRRTRLHKAVGEAIERLYGENNDARLGELARHFLLATRPTDVDKAISYARRAGEAALSALGPDDAVRYFSQALELVSQTTGSEPTLRIDLLIGLGTAQRQAGVAEFRTNLLEAARLAKNMGATDRLIRAALANSRGYATLGTVDTDRVEVLEAALAVLPERDSPERARLLSTLCSELAYGPLDRRLSLASDATAIAHRLGDPATLVAVARDCHMPKRIPALLDETLADNLEALEAAERLGDPVMLCFAAGNVVIDATRAARFDLLDRCLSIMEEQAERVRQPGLRRDARTNRAAKAMLEGDTIQAEDSATAAFEIGAASGEPDAFGFYGAQLASIRSQQGRLGELVSVIDDLVKQNPGLPGFRSALATANLQAGDEDAARALLEEDIVAGFSIHEDTAWLTTILSYSRVPIELNMPEQAERLLELLAPFHSQVHHDGITCLGAVATFVGGLAATVARFDDAEEYFRESSDLCTRGNMRFGQAYTKLLWGRMLRIRGGPDDVNRARSLLEQAQSTAVVRGYAFVECQAAAELSNLK